MAMNDKDFLIGTIQLIAKGYLEVREVDGEVEFKVTDKGIAHAITHLKQEIEI